jgi:hypothetical protein
VAELLLEQQKLQDVVKKPGQQRLIDDGTLRYFELSHRIAVEVTVSRPHGLAPLQATMRLA